MGTSTRDEIPEESWEKDKKVVPDKFKYRWISSTQWELKYQ